MAKTPTRTDAKVDTPTRDAADTRVTLPIDERGLLDVDRMQGRSKERVKEWFQNAKIAAQLGVSAAPIASAPSAAPDVLPDALIHSLVNTIGQLSAALIEKIYGCTPEQAAMMQFNVAEREAIAPPLRTVLNKYGSTVLAKYGDEIALVAILGSTIANKAASVQAAMRQPARVIQHPSSPQTGVEVNPE